jgi:hypothetical protein
MIINALRINNAAIDLCYIVQNGKGGANRGKCRPTALTGDE